MGLRSWLRRNTSPKPKRPWVRPEFLGLALLAAVLLIVGLSPVFLGGSDESGSAAQRTEYVGIVPGAAAALDCQPTCAADVLLQQWMAAHPSATVLQITPQREDGRLVGYEIVYVE